MTIVAIDPGSRLTGIAFIDGPRAWSMVMKSQTVTEINQFMIRCVGLFDQKPGGLEFVLEDQHLVEHGPRDSNGRGKVNWPSIVALVVSRVRWQTIAELRGVKVTLANTGAWQSKMHGTVSKISNSGKAKSRKRRSKDVVAKVWQNVPRIAQPFDVLATDSKPRASDKVTNDEADALCIGRYHQLYGSQP